MNSATKESPSTGSKPLARLRVACFLLASISLLAVFSFQRVRSRRLDQEHEHVQTRLVVLNDELAGLQKTIRRLEESSDQTRLHGIRIKEIIKHCREPNELWHNDSVMGAWAIDYGGHMNDVVRLLLPEGNHTLHFQMQRQRLDSEETAEMTKLEFPVAGPAAYEIALDLPRAGKAKYRDPRELSLRISSSDAQFTPVKKRLLSDRVPPPSSSSSGFLGPHTRPFFFPNQRDPNQNQEPGVLLNRMTWTISPKGAERFRLRFELRLTSDGPEVVSANEWSSFQYGSDQPVVNYLGRGRYEIVQ